MAWLQFGGIGDLPVVADGAAYSELSVDDSKETDSFTKYGGYVGITEKVIRNSDIAKIQAIPRALTVAAVQTRSAKIAAIFSQASGTGPTLDQDSIVLFHTDSHGNLATTAFSWTAWKAARIECAKHAELASSKRTGFFPKYGLVPRRPLRRRPEGLWLRRRNRRPARHRQQRPQPLRRRATRRPAAHPHRRTRLDRRQRLGLSRRPTHRARHPNGLRRQPQPAAVTRRPSSTPSPVQAAGLMFTNDVLPIKVRDYFAYGVATYRGIGKRNVT